MKTLIFGSNGLVGSNILAESVARGHDVAGTYHTSKPKFDVPIHECDVRNQDRISNILEDVQPDIVYNCVAMTNVDACETHPERAREVNTDAPETLATECSDFGAKFVHFSTDYVFDGQRTTPYEEDASTNPIQIYGQTKRTGEERVLDASRDTLVVRLSFVYGTHGATGQLEGFPAWVRDRLNSDESVPLFTDQHITPSRAGQVATATLDLLDTSASGLVHVASRTCITPYEFGQAIREQMGVDRGVDEASHHDIDRDAPRPPYTCLDVARVEELLGRPQPTVRDDLDSFLEVF